MKSDHGSVSLVVAAGVAMALIVAMGVADVARALVARSHAEAAADLAALAAAQELALPSGADPASFAAAYAAANDARLVSCSCASDSQEAVVTVAVAVGGFLLPLPDREILATARAVVDVPASALFQFARARIPSDRRPVVRVRAVHQELDRRPQHP